MAQAATASRLVGRCGVYRTRRLRDGQTRAQNKHLRRAAAGRERRTHVSYCRRGSAGADFESTVQWRNRRQRGKDRTKISHRRGSRPNLRRGAGGSATQADQLHALLRHQQHSGNYGVTGATRRADGGSGAPPGRRSPSHRPHRPRRQRRRQRPALATARRIRARDADSERHQSDRSSAPSAAANGNPWCPAPTSSRRHATAASK